MESTGLLSEKPIIVNTESQIEEVDVSRWEKSKKFAVIVHEVFTPEECHAMIQRAECQGFEAALVNTGGGTQHLMNDYRKSKRVIIDDPIAAEDIWQRVCRITRDERLLRAPWCNREMHAVGLNERLRFLKYNPGDFFASHYDGSYMRSEEAGSRKGERSFITLQLYLNDGFEGGATRFLDPRDEILGVDVVPRAGSVLLFQHDCCHEGSLLVKGVKYAIRTDVMFTSKGVGHEYARDPIVISEPTKSMSEGPFQASPYAEIITQALNDSSTLFRHSPPEITTDERVGKNELDERRAQLFERLVTRRKRCAVDIRKCGNGS